MKVKKLLRILAIIAILISNIGCDQISKQIVRQHLNYYEQIRILNNFFIITKIENPGAFLSFGSTSSGLARLILLTILPSLILGVGFLYLILKRKLSPLKTLGISFVLGGGIGNMYDRIVYGSVTDFLHIDFNLFQTGIFNMADVSITTGVAITLLDSFVQSKQLRAIKERADS